MVKHRKANVIIDIIIAILFISTVLYFCYSLATSSINKRQQINLEREAMTIAENIMNRVLSKGVYTIESEPIISDEVLDKINKKIEENYNLPADKRKTQAQLNEEIILLGGRLPVNRDIDAPFLPPGDTYRNKFSYQVIVDDYISKTGTDASGNPTYSKHAGLKRIVVNVYYPAKVVKYLDRKENTSAEEIANGTASSKDLASSEEEYRVVTLTTYKAAREYEIYD